MNQISRFCFDLSAAVTENGRCLTLYLTLDNRQPAIAMSDYAAALRRKPPSKQPVSVSSQQQGQGERNGQEKLPQTAHAPQEPRAPTEQSSSARPVVNAWGPRPTGTATASMKRPKEALQLKEAPNKRPKSKKPKPTLQNMSLGDLIPRDAMRLGKSQPKASRPITPAKKASNDQDFPSLGASVSSSVPKAKPALPAQTKWAKPAAARTDSSKKPAARSAVSSKPPQAARSLTKTPKQSPRPAAAAVSAKTPQEEQQTTDWQSFGAKPRDDGGEELELIRLLQDGKFRSQKKGRQRLAPRKKKFSTLKKKILQERLAAWRELHPEDAPQQQSDASPVGSCTVCLNAFADSEEVEDNDEYEEIVKNLRDMATKVGPIRDAFVSRQLSGACPAFVWFEKPQGAAAACACWDGLMIGGQGLEPIALNPTFEVNDESVTNEMWRQAVVSIESTEKDFAMEDATSAEVTASVVLRNILSKEDFEDPECLEESIADIRSLVQQHGSVSDVQARHEDDGGVVIVTYNGGPSVASNAVTKLDGIVLGGTTVSASPLEASTDLGKKACVVQLKNVLTADDFEDDDCLQESVGDIEALAKQFGPVSDVQAHKEDGGCVFITYNADPSVAMNAAEKLDGSLLGGNTIQANVIYRRFTTSSDDETSCVVLQHILTKDDFEDEECLEESMADVKELASQYGKVLGATYEINEAASVVEIKYDGGKQVAEYAASKFNGMVIGGQVVVATVLTKESETPDQKSCSAGQVAEVAAKPSDPPPLYSGDKLIPERFAECKRAPKVSSAAGPRHYATVSGDEDVKALLIDMLSELMRLQRRAVEDKNSKARRRIVMGLREVARGIRSHKVKMVVMANNLDQYGAIDEKLQEILDLARAEDVPLLFELNKRHLGKAVGKSIKVSVVGIQSAEGAHQQFKKLAALAVKHAAPIN